MWSTIYIEESKEQANGPLMWSTERIILTNYIQESKELEHKPLMFRRKKYSVLIFKRHILYCRVKKCKQIKIVRCSKKKLTIYTQKSKASANELLSAAQKLENTPSLYSRAKKLSKNTFMD